MNKAQTYGIQYKTKKKNELFNKAYNVWERDRHMIYSVLEGDSDMIEGNINLKHMVIN